MFCKQARVALAAGCALAAALDGNAWAEDVTNAAARFEQTTRTVGMVFWVVGIGIGVLAAVYIALKIRNEMASTSTPRSNRQEALETAVKAEKKGEYITAALSYVTLGDTERAAMLYEKGKDYARAAAIYEEMKKYKRAVELYKRGGASLKAAGVLMKTGQYLEAAKIYKNKGDLVRTGDAFEKMGNRLAAAREYAEAGQYLKAAKMYTDEEVYDEASAVFYKTIEDQLPNRENLGKFYAYAALLVMAGSMEEAENVYLDIIAVDPEYREARAKLHAIGVQTGKVEPPVQEQEPDEVEGIEVAVDAPIPSDEPITADEPAGTGAAEPVRAGEPVGAGAGAANAVLGQGEVDDLFSSLAGEIAAESAAARKRSDARAEAEAEAGAAAGTADDEAAGEADTPVAAAAPKPAAAVKPIPKPTTKAAKPAAPTAQAPSADPDLDEEAAAAALAALSAPPEEEAAPVEEIDVAQPTAEDIKKAPGGQDTLRGLMQYGRLEPAESMRICMQVMRLLYDQHGKGAYYGCLPPESIIMDANNNVKLTPPGMSMPEYTAPEVADGAMPNEKSDVYAMGVLMYEMLAGGLDQFGARGPRHAHKDVPEWLDDLVMRCTDPSPSARYNDLGEVSSILMMKASSL